MADLASVTPSLDTLLQRLPAELRDAVVEAASLRSLAAGERIVIEGQIVDELYLVERGMLAANVRDAQNRPVEVSRLSAGDIFGEMSFFLGERASASLRALGDAEVWALPHDSLGGAAERDGEFMAYLAAGLAARVRRSNARLRRRRQHRAVLAVMSADSSWGRRFVAEVGRAAAVYQDRATLLVDLDGRATDLIDGAGAAPGIDELCRRPELMHEFELAATAQRGGLVVTAPTTEPIESGNRLSQTIDALRLHFGLIVVCAALDQPLQTALATDLDRATFFVEEGDRNPTEKELPSDLQTILLRHSTRTCSAGELIALSHWWGRPVVQAIPGGPRPWQSGTAVGEVLQGSARWTARHFLGQKVGLALGSGGAKGFAHIGVLEELHRSGLTVDYVAGTSIGAPIAAAIAAGWDPAQIKEQLERISREVVRRTLPVRSLLSSRRLRQEIESISERRTFEGMQIPLALLAVDIDRRSEVLFREGDVAAAIVASFSIPAIYPPVQSGDRTLVDGALLTPIPIKAVADLGADIVIAVQLTDPVNEDPGGSGRRALFTPPILQTVSQAFEVMQWKITTDGAIRADVAIEPVFDGPISLADFDRADELVAAGRRAAARARPRIAELLPWIDRQEGSGGC